MAQRTHKLLINAAKFPFSYFKAARSAIENQDIGPRLPGFFAGAQENFDFGQPQLLYCENIMPDARGLLVPGIGNFAGAPSGPAVTDFDLFVPVSKGDGSFRAMSPGNGKKYIFDTTDPQRFIASGAPVVYSGEITTANVDGRTFICFPNTSIVEWDETAGVFNTISFIYPPGTTIADVKGISSAGNYLLFFTTFGIHWCSPLNILDFNDINQGAGNQTPTDLVGSIVCIQPISGGAIIYARASVIGMRFTNQAAAPFIFKAVPGGNGVGFVRNVAGNYTGGYHFSYGKGALQRITLTAAESVFPDLAEVLVSRSQEFWNASTKAVTLVRNVTDVKLTLVDGRYFIVSQGSGAPPDTYTIAYIYDMVLERWGRLNISHVDVFSWSDTVGASQTGLGFLRSNGDRLRVLVDTAMGSFFSSSLQGVAVFGHIQERHDRFITVHEVIIDMQYNFNGTPVLPAVFLLLSDNGADRSSVVTMASEVDGTGANTRRYTSRATAQNADIAIEGLFAINTLLAKVMKHGYR